MGARAWRIWTSLCARANYDHLELVAGRALLRSTLRTCEIRYAQICAKAFSTWRTATSRWQDRKRAVQTRAIGNNLCHDALKNVQRSFSSAISATLENRAVTKRSLATPPHDGRSRKQHRPRTERIGRFARSAIASSRGDNQQLQLHTKSHSAFPVLRGYGRRGQLAGDRFVLRLRRRLEL